MKGWIVGAEVSECRTGWSRATYGPPMKIGKVYANGNFILEGDETKQQWRPTLNMAVRTSSGRFASRGNHLVLWTDEARVKAEETNKAAAAAQFLRKLSESLDKLGRGNDDEEIIKKAEELGFGK